MSRPDKRRVSTNGGGELGQNPFAASLAKLGPLMPSAQESVRVSPGAPKTAQASESAKNRGRVDVLRSTAGRGGKTVTVAKNFIGIGLPEKEALCKTMRAAAGCGGTVKDGAIEIQGDQREVVARVLREAGFRPVMAGG
jgi:translation initiation factor 1